MSALLTILGQPGPSEREIEQFAAAMGGVFILLAIGVAILFFFVWGMIFSRAGYSFAMVFLMLIPLVNLIWLLIFAFSRWPVQKELDAYRRGAYGPPQPYAPPRY